MFFRTNCHYLSQSVPNMLIYLNIWIQVDKLFREVQKLLHFCKRCSLDGVPMSLGICFEVSKAHSKPRVIFSISCLQPGCIFLKQIDTGYISHPRTIFMFKSSWSMYNRFHRVFSVLFYLFRFWVCAFIWLWFGGFIWRYIILFSLFREVCHCIGFLILY